MDFQGTLTVALVSGIAVALLSGGVTVWVAFMQQHGARKDRRHDHRRTTYAETLRAMRHFNDVVSNNWNPTHYWGGEGTLELFWMASTIPSPELRLTGSPRVVGTAEQFAAAVGDYAELETRVPSAAALDGEPWEPKEGDPTPEDFAAQHQTVEIAFNFVVAAMRSDLDYNDARPWKRSVSAPVADQLVR